jgi:hypothetical protein
MKKFFAFAVVLLAIAASAFTSSAPKHKFTGNSYSYNLYGLPGQDLAINLNNPNNYTFFGTGPLTGCSVGAHRCGVQNATDNGAGHPDFSKSYTPIPKN